VEAWLKEMYEQHRACYVRCAVAGIYALAFFMGALVGGIGCRVEGVPIEKSLIAIGLVELLVLATIPAIDWILRPAKRAMMDWSEGDRSSIDAARRARSASLELTQGVLKAGLRVSLTTIPAIGPLSILLVDHNLDVADYLVLSLGGVLGTLQWGITSYFALDLAMRPIAQETGEVTGDYEERPRVASLTTKLLLGVMASTLLSGIFVGAFVTDPGEGTAGLLKIFAVGAVAASIIGLASVVPILLTVLGPVRALTLGTRWVGVGRFGWRVPVVSTDELGELAGSFNQMAEELGARTEELRASRARIIASSDQTRQKVERDLHDGAQQHLVLLDLKLGLVKKLVSDNHRGVAALEEAEADLERALSELRDLAHGIYPSVLSNDGLHAALGYAASRSPIPVTVDVDGERRFEPELEAAVYFCCLEALQNAGKYAGEGATATVRLSAQGHELMFEVCDDGRGFDPSSVNGSAGLQNMADRVGALGGEVRVESEPGEGTTVAGSIPIGGNAWMLG
jgi:signal transduction histidine kinase